MQTSSRNHEQPDPRSFAARKGHLPQLSISDDNHHVTEAIGYMYGDDDSPSSPQSPARYSTRSDRSIDGEADLLSHKNSSLRNVLPDRRMANGERISPILESQVRSPLRERNAWNNRAGPSPISPMGGVENSPTETATTHFPLNDIDYESSPAAVAQELSNLQALRRMSMDVGAAGDPDLPQLNAATLPGAPSASTSEDDSARLFWVPASLHPELAPKEFKTFLESKAELIKRRSGELSSFSSSVMSRSSSLNSDDSSGGLQRKKSMLSRQINNSVGYQDGADRLEEKKSREQNGSVADPNLEELEYIVSNGNEALRQSLETKRDSDSDDIILPSVPGSSLKRSTRTKYQRPNSRKGHGDRGTYAERARRKAEAGSVDPASPVLSNASLASDSASLSGFSNEVSNIASTLKDPSYVDSPKPALNFSRPAPSPSSSSYESSRNVPATSFDSLLSKAEDAPGAANQQPLVPSKQLSQKPTITKVSERLIPQIVESPPPEDHPVRKSSMVPPPSVNLPAKIEGTSSSDPSSPRDQRQKLPTSQRPGMPPKQSSANMSSGRSGARNTTVPPQTTPTQTLDQPSPLPGNDTNTSNLSYIPTLTVDKRQEPKKKEEKKSGWGWLLGKEESDKEKDKAKHKSSKNSQSHDSTRLDLLQTSIDGGPKGRESLVLDRDSLRLEEERKKESQRKSSTGEKKEKESIFSSIFGGKKHKAEKESQKRAQERLSPEPPYRELKADIDYNWTRFSILEERAIYRMAHIKLANPRRALYSQVLLSNFMYSYLAKVQQMHPQMNLPTSAKQQRKQKEQQQLMQQQQQQPDEFTQYQRYQQQQQAQTNQQIDPSTPPSAQQSSSRQSVDNDQSLYDFSYSRNGTRSEAWNSESGAESSSVDGSEQYTENSGGGQSYHRHQQERTSREQKRQRGTSANRYDDDDDDDDDDMW